MPEEAIWKGCPVTRIVSKKPKTKAVQLTTELNVHLDSGFHQNCLSGAPHNQYTMVGLIIAKPLVTHVKCQMSVLLVPTMHICGRYSVVKSQRGLTPRLLCAQSKALGFISDGLGYNIMAFPTVLYVHVTAKDYRAILEDHVHLMVQILYPEGGAVYQHRVSAGS